MWRPARYRRATKTTLPPVSRSPAEPRDTAARSPLPVWARLPVWLGGEEAMGTEVDGVSTGCAEAVPAGRADEDPEGVASGELDPEGEPLWNDGIGVEDSDCAVAPGLAIVPLKGARGPGAGAAVRLVVGVGVPDDGVGTGAAGAARGALQAKMPPFHVPIDVALRRLSGPWGRSPCSISSPALSAPSYTTLPR